MASSTRCRRRHGNGRRQRLRSDFRDARLRPGEAAITITVVINRNRKKDTDETFFVDLSGAVNALLLDDQGLGIILSDDWK